MRLNEYQKIASNFGVYREHMFSNLDRMTYTALGLSGESGEFLETIIGFVYTDDSSVDSIIKEMGDVLWYAAACATEHDWSLESALANSVNPIGDRSTALTFAAMRTAAEAGKYADMVKKFMRGEHSGVFNSFVDKINQRDAMAVQIGVVLHCLRIAASMADISMDQVMQANLDKLNARKTKGTLFSTESKEDR